jgi:hypothetical protein
MIATWGANRLNAALSFWLPLTDAGAGAVNLAPVSSAGDATATFTRATTAWTKLSSGLWALVASGTARSCYLGADTTVGAYGGYLSESARTNECLQARDFSNASWTKSSVSASAARRFSVFMKRITGTGNIDLTLDNGTTWTTVSGSINSATFTRVAIGQTVTNPTVGIRIVTSGDKVAVDMAQEEVGTFDTSPIPTTTTSVTRNADVLSYASAGNVGASAGTIYAGVTLLAAGPNPASIVNFGGGVTTLYAAPTLTLRDGTNIATAGSLVVGAVAKAAAVYGAAAMKAAKDGTFGSSSSFDGDMNVSAIQIGHTGGSNQFNGLCQNVRLWSRALSDSEVAKL